MARASGAAISLARELGRRFREDGERTELYDGSEGLIEPSHYGGYTIYSSERDDDGPIWTVTADHSEMDMLNPPLTLIVQGGGEMYFMRMPDETVPEWTLPILKNIVFIEDIQSNPEEDIA